MGYIVEACLNVQVKGSTMEVWHLGANGEIIKEMLQG
jgi:hypothetical protein